MPALWCWCSPWASTCAWTTWQPGRPSPIAPFSRPILINFDGYYYLSLARELRDGTYGGQDDLRGVPQSPRQPALPPLIALMAAGLARITPLSLDWIGCLLPTVLGLSLAWPLVLLSRMYGGRLMAVVAAGLGLFGQYYVYRSHLGWFDTDCLNVTFVFLICYFFIAFGITPGRRRYLYLAAGLSSFGLFTMWWDQAPALVTLISLSPLALVVILYYRPVGRERTLALVLGAACLLGLMLWQGPRIITAPFESAVQQWRYIARQQTGDFPNVGVSVLEQDRMGLADLVLLTTGHWVTFLAGLAGLALLAWQHRRKAAALIVPFALGGLSFLFARRFIIFLNPFLAIGLGYAAHAVWRQRTRWPLLRYAAPALIALVVLVPFRDSVRKVYWPKEIPPLVEGMDYLARSTPDNAVVWAR